MLEPVLVQGDRERLAPTAQDFYCVHRTALNMLPPAETFPILRRLCMALLRAAVAAASTRKVKPPHVVELYCVEFVMCACLCDPSTSKRPVLCSKSADSAVAVQNSIAYTCADAPLYSSVVLHNMDNRL
jgi:hypothetical protein